MESNRRPGKGTPKKKPSAAGPKSSSRTTRTGTARSNARSTKSEEDIPRSRTLKSPADQLARRPIDKTSNEDRQRRSSSPERPARFDKGKPRNSEDRPRRSSSPERPARFDKDKPRSSEDRARRSSSPERSSRFDSDKPSSSEDRPRRSNTTECPLRRSPENPGSEDRPRRSSNTRSSGSNSGEGLIRLNKYIANSGICSRREADELIMAGTVMVNGKVVTELGTKVSLSDKVQYDNHTIRNERHVYVLLNKPKGYITTTDDPFDRKTVMALVEGACKERIYPVGRLDRNTTGLLLLTNDGEMAKKLTHPRHKVKKVYHVELERALSKSDMLTIAAGVELDDGMAMIDEIAYASEAASKKEVGIELHSGKNRIVRRIFEAVGYEVVKLDRVIFAGLTKKDLPRGQYRMLTEQEVNYLKMLK